MIRVPILLFLASLSAGAQAREVVDASVPEALSVTVYRDPERGPDEAMDRNLPQGFAMISETRSVTLPPGESTIRFEGVAEGMVAVTAIVTGLPGGTIEKNRNADLLSPAALVDGTLGNRVTITRTNPATGQAQSESAIVRTRADGGLVLQTSEGYEAVRCSGLPEELTFDSVPQGLSAQPVFSIDTRDPAGGTYRVTLTYLAWGFDWQAHYVATLQEGGAQGKRRLRLLSWLTLLNDNGQTFADAELLAVAGKLNVESDFEALSDPPQANPLRLMCYPLGSTAAGSPIVQPLPAMAAAAPIMGGDEIMVTARRVEERLMDVPKSVAMVASEEQLGDLKLYRVPEPVSVAARSLKQVAFLNRENVQGELIYAAQCQPWNRRQESQPALMVLRTVNDERHGLGVALPMGGVTLFEPSGAGELLVGENRLRDYAVGQDVEIELAESTNVFATCTLEGEGDWDETSDQWRTMRVVLSNANSRKVAVRLDLGPPARWQLRKTPGRAKVEDGVWRIETGVGAGKRRELTWQIRPANTEADE